MSNPDAENGPYADRTKRKTTTEQLAEIRAKCVELLAIAEKRTRCNWMISFHHNQTTVLTGDGRPATSVAECCIDEAFLRAGESTANAAFIASCAGPAEAGWKATIAVIDELTKDASWFFGQPQNCSAAALSTIIKIWKTLVLSKNMV